MVSSTDKRNRIETLVRSCQVVERMNRNSPEVSQSEKLYYRMLTRYFSNVMNAPKEGIKTQVSTREFIGIAIRCT